MKLQKECDKKEKINYRKITFVKMYFLIRMNQFFNKHLMVFNLIHT